MTETAMRSNGLGGAASIATDLRNAVRYALRAKAIFRWTDSSGAKCEEQGYTRDISARGAFIVCRHWPPTGALLSLTIYLLTPSGPEKDLRMRAKGKVLRVELRSGPEKSPGFAVQNEWMRYERAG